MYGLVLKGCTCMLRMTLQIKHFYEKHFMFFVERARNGFIRKSEGRMSLLEIY